MLAKRCEPQNPPEQFTTIQPRLPERPGAGTAPAQRPQNQQRSALGHVNTFPRGLHVPKAEDQPSTQPTDADFLTAASHAPKAKP